jgi:exo-beta-1,3-glucanase (GH17 family)/cellulose synthase/poly-beta-1,6-N-acetylglucosamine synthase-like glycosyltransferase
MKLSGLLVAVFFALATFALWAYLNRPVEEPKWPEVGAQGMAFSPFRGGQDPAQRVLPSLAQIDADLKLLADSSVSAVRTYSALDSLGDVPAIAARHGIKVTVGAWLDRQREVNRREIDGAMALAQRHSNVIRVIVGNEVVLRGDLSVSELATELDRVREVVKQPVSTAEPWHVWVDNPRLAEHVDFITVHLLPYWEGIDVQQAVDYIISRMDLLQATFPGKLILIGEVGWPSAGRTRGSAVASVSNEAAFLRRFLEQAMQRDYRYYIMEAFDQPWKARYEGAVGAYWGVYDVERQPKFAFDAPIVRIPRWHLLAGISVGLAALLLGFFYMHSRTLGTRGRSLLAIVVYATATVAVWIVYDFSQQYFTVRSAVSGVVLILGMLGVIAVLLAEAHEWAEAHWATSRSREFAPSAVPAQWPTVSIHVPAYNEPPAMLIQTLDALAALRYPSYEVLVIDNNTTDPKVWQPVAAHCERLGPRFKFFHIEALAGFKAGALNFALLATDPQASVIAVVDSDYQVDPQWLTDLVPAFGDPRTAIVQAPQDYRDEQQSFFKAMCYAEYRGFFHIGMITRNERNAIIQHGTMTLVRRASLEEVGGWAQWCITEDAELGLRLFEHGYEASYLPRSYGRGVMPDRFADYKRQRFRWAYGAMQIVRHHARALLSRTDRRLSAGQRYHFIAGWLPWAADGVNLLFNGAAILWSLAMLIAPQRIDPPLVMFSVLPLALFTFKLLKLAHLYTSRIGANVRQTLAAALAGLALTHTIGTAVLKAAFTREQPFERTPKQSERSAAATALAAARYELLLLVALTSLAWTLGHPITLAPGVMLGIPEGLRGPDTSVWVAVLLIQSIPYAATVLVALISAWPWPARWLGAASLPTSATAIADR